MNITLQRRSGKQATGKPSLFLSFFFSLILALYDDCTNINRCLFTTYDSKGYSDRTIGFFRSFEKFIHPRVLFFYLPIGLMSYYTLSTGTKYVYNNYIATPDPVEMTGKSKNKSKKAKWKQKEQRESGV